MHLHVLFVCALVYTCPVSLSVLCIWVSACVLSLNSTALTLRSHVIVLQSPTRRIVLTVVFVLGLEHHCFTSPVIKKKKKKKEPCLLLSVCAYAWVCPSVGDRLYYSPPFTLSCPREPLNLPVKNLINKIRWMKSNWFLPPLPSPAPLLPVQRPAIFIRACYGRSLGKNNINMVVTGMSTKDESRIKIKKKEYKVRLPHLEGE